MLCRADSVCASVCYCDRKLISFGCIAELKGQFVETSSLPFSSPSLNSFLYLRIVCFIFFIAVITFRENVIGQLYTSIGGNIIVISQTFFCLSVVWKVSSFVGLLPVLAACHISF